MARYVKFLRGTPEAYKKLTQKDSDTLYFIYENDESSGVLYLGKKLIAGCPDGEDASITSLEQLKDVVLKEVKDDSFLVYDKEISAWTNKELKDLVYVGATEKSGGIPGLVPAASANAKDLFLRADGTWSSPGATSQLKRKIVESVDEIDLKSAQATQFIYMVPTGTVTDHNVYKEYIVLDIEKNGVINRVLEQIGSWDVNLSDYATVKQLSALQEQVDNLASMDNSIIKSVDTEKFSITSSGELKLLNLPISQITDLTNILNKGQQTEGGYHLINQEEKRKLDALVINEENGDLEISATVEASKVQGLGNWITEHSTGKNYIIGLSENNFTDERAAKLDNMLGIVSTDSSLKVSEQGQLQLNNISTSQVTNLDSILNSKVDTTLFSAMDLRVGATEKKIKNLEEAFTWEELH